MVNLAEQKQTWKQSSNLYFFRNFHLQRCAKYYKDLCARSEVSAVEFLLISQKSTKGFRAHCQLDTAEVATPWRVLPAKK